MKKILFLTLICLACFGKIDERDNNGRRNPNLVVQKDGVCTIMCEKCAINIYFTFDIEEYKKGFENEDDAYTMLDDAIWYRGQTFDYLREYKIPVSTTIFENTCPTLKFGDIEMAFPQDYMTSFSIKRARSPTSLKILQAHMMKSMPILESKILKPLKLIKSRNPKETNNEKDSDFRIVASKSFMGVKGMEWFYLFQQGRVVLG